MSAGAAGFAGVGAEVFAGAAGFAGAGGNRELDTSGRGPGGARSAGAAGGGPDDPCAILVRARLSYTKDESSRETTRFVPNEVTESCGENCRACDALGLSLPANDVLELWLHPGPDQQDHQRCWYADWDGSTPIQWAQTDCRSDGTTGEVYIRFEHDPSTRWNEAFAHAEYEHAAFMAFSWMVAGTYQHVWVLSTDKPPNDLPTDYEQINRAVVGIDKGSGAFSVGAGLLVAPRLVLTAGHSIHAPSAVQTIEFGTDSRSPAQQINKADSFEFPGFGDTNNEDLGIIVLEHPSNVALPHWKHSSAVWGDLTLYGFDGVAAGRTRGPLYQAMCTGTTTYSEWDGHRVNSECGGARSGDGDSGGPIFDTAGALVGINVGSSSSIDSIAMGMDSRYTSWIDEKIELYRNVLVTGDFDGDGYDDLFFWNPNGLGNWVDLAVDGYPDGVADGDTVEWCTQELKTGDFNGNGRQDLLCFNDEEDRLDIDYASDSGQFGGTDALLQSSWCGRELLVGDFNGDGLDDLFCRDTGGWRRVDLNDGTSHPFTGSDWEAQSSWCGQELYVGDFNADGRDDLLCRDPGYAYYLKYATADGDFSTPHVRRTTGWCEHDLHIGDFDGDGADDLLCWDQDGNNLALDYAAPSDPFPFSGTDWSKSNSWCTQDAQVADINGDGMADVVCHDDRQGKVSVDLCDGATTFDGLDDRRIPDIDSGVWP